MYTKARDGQNGADASWTRTRQASRQHVQGRSWLQPNLMHETRISNQETTQAKGRSQRMEKENDKGKGARSHAARVKES